MHHLPAFLIHEPPCLHRCIKRTDRFRRVPERRIIGVHHGLRQHRHHREVEPYRPEGLVQRLLEHIPDHPLALSTADIERHRWEGVLRHLIPEEDIPHLGAVPMGNGDSVTLTDDLHNVHRGPTDICKLLFSGAHLLVPQDGIATKRDHYSLLRHLAHPRSSVQVIQWGPP